MEGNTMKKTALTVAVTLAVLYAIGKDAHKQKEIDDLKGRVERLNRWNDYYHDSLRKTVNMLDREERRNVIRQFNEGVDFIRITNRI
jgi:hypothetical protein